MNVPRDEVIEAQVRIVGRIGEALMSEPDLIPVAFTAGETLKATTEKSEDFFVQNVSASLMGKNSDHLRETNQFVGYVINLLTALHMSVFFAEKEAKAREAKTN